MINNMEKNMSKLLYDFKRISIITGHYGSGKTNIAVNLAFDIKKSGRQCTIVDLDIVNPYFRTADFKAQLEVAGINVITPIYANTNLDIPALPPQINSIFDTNDHYVIIDVGGDDSGAVALGQFANRIANSDYDMFYIINGYRYLTKDADETCKLLNDIESVSRVKATKIINNSNLGALTTADTLSDSLKFASEVSDKAGIPLAFSCIKRELYNGQPGLYPVDVLVKAIWDD